MKGTRQTPSGNPLPPTARKSGGLVRASHRIVDAKHVVFVYGTLLRGEANHAVLRGARFLGTARTTPGYELLDLGEYPAMRAGGATAVEGETYAVDPAHLAELDRFEDVPRSYVRAPIVLEDGCSAHAYLAATPARAVRSAIPSGSWRRRRST
jgi:gamma-glutamylaminecyclotransferase